MVYRRFRARFADFVKRSDCLLLMACRGALAVALRTRVSAVFPPLCWADRKRTSLAQRQTGQEPEICFVRRSECSRCSRDDARSCRLGRPSCITRLRDAQKPSVKESSSRRDDSSKTAEEFGERKPAGLYVLEGLPRYSNSKNGSWYRINASCMSSHSSEEA